MLQKCQNDSFLKLVLVDFHAILTCGLVQTSFQIDIEIYEDKLRQSGDRIFSSHITNKFNILNSAIPTLGHYIEFMLLRLYYQDHLYFVLCLI